MRIIFLGRYEQSEILTGPQKVAFNLFFNINQEKLNATFITYFFKNIKSSNFVTRLFGKKILNKNPRIIRYGIFPIIVHLFFNKPQLVHIITFERFQIPIIILSKLLHIRIIYTVHGIYRYELEILHNKPSVFSKFKDLLVEKLIYSKSDALIFLSSQMIQLAEKYYKVDRRKTSIIPNGVSLVNNSKKKVFDFRNQMELVFYNGLGSSRNRGLEDLIAILEGETIKKFHLSVLGNPIKTDNQQISFIDPLPESLLFSFLNDKQIFIDNLFYIPFSIMALESMSLGLIVIVSDKSGISSFINDGENGFIFESENPDKIRGILNDISAKKYNLELISSNAIETAKKLSWDKIANQYIRIYQELLK